VLIPERQIISAICLAQHTRPDIAIFYVRLPINIVPGTSAGIRDPLLTPAALPHY
jgi:hypothetical protein